MSDENQENEIEVIETPISVPPQFSPSDTSNQDHKESVDPSGQKYIRTLSDNEKA